MKKESKNQKTFQENAHKQGSKNVPLDQIKDYGTGLPFKKPKTRMSKLKK